MSPWPFDDAPPLQFFTGKGGVGKSSVVLGVGHELASRGRRVLLVELGHRGSFEQLLGREIGTAPVAVGPRIDAVRVDFESALEAFLIEQVKVRRIAKTLLDSEVLGRFFRAAPAVPEVVTFRALRRYEESGPYDAILVDLDATGHAKMFLSLPRVFDGLAASGPLRTILDDLAALLRDPKRSVLHLVTLPSPLPAQETLELVRDIRSQRLVELGVLVVNRLPIEVAAPSDVEVSSADQDPARSIDLSVANALVRDRTLAIEEVARLRATELPMLELFELGANPSIERLSAEVARARADEPPLRRAPGGDLDPRGLRFSALEGTDAVDRLLNRGLLVCVGPGGVGKTTVAASFAARAASEGKRALVLTIDPAKRLADALGLDGLSDEISERPCGAGRLGAAMIDTEQSYDALIGRIADPHSRDRILNNRVYRAFSKTLARSHAYVAMERLYHELNEGWDLIVLDTPPTRNALEILDAPSFLAQFLEEDVIRFFLKKERGLRGGLARLAQFGGKAALKILGAIAGEAVVEDLVEFFGTLAHLREGFHERSSAVRARLLDDDTGYALVFRPSAAATADAKHLLAQLRQRGLPKPAIVTNRAFPLNPFSNTQPLSFAPEIAGDRYRAARNQLVADARGELVRALDGLTISETLALPNAALEYQKPESALELASLLDATHRVSRVL